jgi:hypothetical protein
MIAPAAVTIETAVCGMDGRVRRPREAAPSGSRFAVRGSRRISVVLVRTVIKKL